MKDLEIEFAITLQSTVDFSLQRSNRVILSKQILFTQNVHISNFIKTLH